MSVFIIWLHFNENLYQLLGTLQIGRPGTSSPHAPALARPCRNKKHLQSLHNKDNTGSTKNRTQTRFRNKLRLNFYPSLKTFCILNLRGNSFFHNQTAISLSIQNIFFIDLYNSLSEYGKEKKKEKTRNIVSIFNPSLNFLGDLNLWWVWNINGSVLDNGFMILIAQFWMLARGDIHVLEQNNRCHSANHPVRVMTFIYAVQLLLFRKIDFFCCRFVIDMNISLNYLNVCLFKVALCLCWLVNDSDHV